MSTVVLYCWCHSDSASVLLYFTFLSHLFPLPCGAGSTVPREGFDSSVIMPFYTPVFTPVFRRDVLWYGDVRPSVRPGLRPSVRHSFPHFSPTCFDILIWNFVYHFIFMHVRSSSNAINFRHFLQELCFFLTSNSYKYAVFRTFLLHALTYLVQILYMTLIQCTTEQVWVPLFCFNFCWSNASLWT